METKRPLLSICIPTFNRAKFLEGSLKCFEEQLQDVDLSEIELYVSDNCSEDCTPQIVQSAVRRGLPITYNRNSQNLGADKNFLHCMQWASGKYVWLLGDDDLLHPGAVRYILDLIRNRNYGVVHLSILHSKDCETSEIKFEDPEEFLKKVSYWITFISSTIFRKDAVYKVASPESFLSTNLLQVPFYIESALMEKENLFVKKIVFDNGLDSCGGFAFYNVFVENYLNIWSTFLSRSLIQKKTYESLKETLYREYLERFNYRLLIRKKDAAFLKTGKGYDVTNAWHVLFRHYWKNGYFYWSFFKYPYFLLRDVLRKSLRIVREKI